MRFIIIIIVVIIIVLMIKMLIMIIFLLLPPKKHLKDHEAGLREIIRGRFGMITFKAVAYLLVTSHYIGNRGNTPYYIGKQDYGISPYFGWGYG